jgi:hypothetical protein
LRVTRPGGRFFCSYASRETFAAQGIRGEDEPTHVCVKPKLWWRQKVQDLDIAEPMGPKPVDIFSPRAGGLLRRLLGEREDAAGPLVQGESPPITLEPFQHLPVAPDEREQLLPVGPGSVPAAVGG